MQEAAYSAPKENLRKAKRLMGLLFIERILLP